METAKGKIMALVHYVGNSVFFLYGGIECDTKTDNVASNNDNEDGTM